MAALLALVAAAAWGSSDYAAGSASRRSSAVSVVVLTHFAAVAALVVVALDWAPVATMVNDLWGSFGPGASTGPVRWSGPGLAGTPTSGDITWGLAAGLGGGLGAMLLFRGLGKGSMAVVAPITATGAAAIPALYGIATGDPATLLGVIGIGLALSAIVLVSLAGDADGAPDDGAEPAERDARPVVDRFGPWTVWARDHPVEASRAARWLDAELASSPITPSSAGRPGVEPAAPVASVGSLLDGAPAYDEPPLAPLTADDARALLRRMRGTMISLMVAATLAAGVAAVGPVVVVLGGGRPAPDDLVLLAVAVVVAGAAVVGATGLRALFLAQPHPEVERRTDPPSFDGRPVRIDRRTDASTFALRSILRQPGVPEALLSGVGFGMFFVFISRTSEDAGHWPLVGARAISVVMFAIAAVLTSTALLPERGSRRWVVLAGALDAAAAVFFVLSTRTGLLSVGAVLASLYPGVTVLLARVIDHERIRRRQLVGLGLAAVAVSCLAI